MSSPVLSNFLRLWTRYDVKKINKLRSILTRIGLFFLFCLWSVIVDRLLVPNIHTYPKSVNNKVTYCALTTSIITSKHNIIETVSVMFKFLFLHFLDLTRAIFFNKLLIRCLYKIYVPFSLASNLARSPVYRINLARSCLRFIICIHTSFFLIAPDSMMFHHILGLHFNSL